MCVCVCLAGVTALGLHRIVAKVGLANAPSRQLFRSLGFLLESTSEVFQEETLALVDPPAALFATLHTEARTADAIDCVS